MADGPKESSNCRVCQSRLATANGLLLSSWIAIMSSMHLGTDVQPTVGPVCAGPKPVSGKRQDRLLRCAAAAHRSHELATGLNFSGLPGRGSRSSRWVWQRYSAWNSPIAYWLVVHDCAQKLCLPGLLAVLPSHCIYAASNGCCMQAAPAVIWHRRANSACRARDQSV